MKSNSFICKQIGQEEDILLDKREIILDEIEKGYLTNKLKNGSLVDVHNQRILLYFCCQISGDEIPVLVVDNYLPY
ncbi:MAG: hypothetical protein ACK5MG_10725 [Bacteroidales bacterium]